MKFTRKAYANWQGSGKEGKGTLTTPSTVLSQTQYSFSSRFEEGVGTNPEELLGAAHAGCFSMKLSFVLGEAGFTPDSIDTTAKVTFEDGRISQVHLDVTAKVPGISEEQFQQAATDAKQNCPISKSLNAAVTMTASLQN